MEKYKSKICLWKIFPLRSTCPYQYGTYKIIIVAEMNIIIWCPKDILANPCWPINRSCRQNQPSIIVFFIAVKHEIGASSTTDFYQTMIGLASKIYQVVVLSKINVTTNCRF